MYPRMQCNRLRLGPHRTAWTGRRPRAVQIAGGFIVDRHDSLVVDAPNLYGGGTRNGEFLECLLGDVVDEAVPVAGRIREHSDGLALVVDSFQSNRVGAVRVVYGHGILADGHVEAVQDGAAVEIPADDVSCVVDASPGGTGIGDAFN